MYSWLSGDEVTADRLNKSQMGLGASAQSSPDMTLKVSEGVVRFDKTEVRYAGGNSPTFTAPGSNNRIDLLTINQSGALEITQGTAATSPATPAYPTTKFVIAEVYLRSAATSIKNTDDSSNGYIYKDARSFTVVLDRFGGDGSDGSLSISSGTTTIDLANAAYVEKNYTSISITGTGKLAFINPNASGTIVRLRSQGNVTLTSSTAPMLDFSSLGAQPGNSPTTLESAGRSGGGGGNGINGAGTGAGTAGAKWTAAAPFYLTSANYLFTKFMGIFCGWPGGGGGFGCTNTGSAVNAGGSGGNGGGAGIIECGGTWTFTTANGISVAGGNGGTGVNASSNFTGGGGGGGAGGGGMFLGLYNTLGSNTGTVNVSTGLGGGGGNNVAGSTGGFGGGGAGGGAGGGVANAGGAGQAVSSAGGAQGTNGGGSSGSSYSGANTVYGASAQGTALATSGASLITKNTECV